MPQIWMTYEELAEMLNCTVKEARERVHLDRLDCKISRDGNKRAKLSMTMICIFIEQLKTVDRAIELAVGDLRHIHGLLSDPNDKPSTHYRWNGSRDSRSG
jgi:hypothetical protein